MKFINFQTNKKTYLVVAAGLVVGLLEATNVHIPGWLNFILMMLGIGFTRSGINSQTKVTVEAVEALVQQVLAQVTTAEASRSPLQPGSVVSVPDGPQIVIGRPSPSKSPEEERAITDALNASQLGVQK